MIRPGALLTLVAQKPAAGGRMLARHGGQVVLVWGAIPGERITARVERSGKGVVYADLVDVLEPSPDRREAAADWRCGGNVFAHVRYDRQVALKGEIIQDALGRIGRVPLPAPPSVIASPEEGYRMRARLHVRDGRIGFYREGTHDLCDATATRQLLPDTNEWIRRAEALLRDERGVAGLELAENMPADERAYHFELHEGADRDRIARAIEPLGPQRTVTDAIYVGGGATLTLTRDVRAFFQGNRFLLQHLVAVVLELLPEGPLVDLYAGVGLFGLARAATGGSEVIAVEGDPVSGADLQRNAAPFAGRVRIERRSVESFLSSRPKLPRNATVLVDPPRTGMTRDALAGVIHAQPPHIVYVSCDVATLARDTRTLLDAGYTLGGLIGFDLFPNTAHVEAVALFHR